MNNIIYARSVKTGGYCSKRVIGVIYCVAPALIIYMKQLPCLRKVSSSANLGTQSHCFTGIKNAWISFFYVETTRQLSDMQGYMGIKHMLHSQTRSMISKIIRFRCTVPARFIQVNCHCIPLVTEMLARCPLTLFTESLYYKGVQLDLPLK